MALDSVRREIVLFGGERKETALGDTWVWDGNDWQERFPDDSPSARATHAMSSQDFACGVVLFGGREKAQGRFLEDTWFWSGENWAMVESPTQPGPRGNHGMTYDANRRRVILFGGILDGEKLSGETWELEESHIMEVAFHKDVPPSVADSILNAHGALVLHPGVNIGGAYRINVYEAAVPDSETTSIVSEEPVILADFVSPFIDHNDGARTATGVNAAMAAPFGPTGMGATGNGIVVGQWESRWTTGDAAGPTSPEPGFQVYNRFFSIPNGGGQCAKNTLVVGAVNSGAPSMPGSVGRMTTFSVWGPTQDGRIKPDIVAPGAEFNTRDGVAAMDANGNPRCFLNAADPDPGITSTACLIPGCAGNCGSVNNNYAACTGTSMSAPVVTGSAALILEQHAISREPAEPPLDSDSLKALLVHTATDIPVHFGGNFMTLQDCDADGMNDDCWPIPAGTPGDGPDYVTGWGLLNTQAAMQKVMAGNPQVTIRPSGCPNDVTFASLPFNSPLAVGGDPTTIGIAGCVDGGGNPLTAIWDWVGYFTVPNGTTQLKVTIAWDDPPSCPPAAGSTGSLLVNDLDLTVRRVTGVGGARIQPSYYSWWLDPSCPYREAVRVSANTFRPGTYADHRNNVEQVIVDNPITSGADETWQIVVNSVGLGMPPQPFAIVISMPPTAP